jgi:hypothetical protein
MLESSMVTNGSRKHLSCAQRTEALFREELTDLAKAGGFRRKRLVFTRVHEGILQIIQAHVSVKVSGGASPDEGFFRIWIAWGLEQPSIAEGCPYNSEIYQVVPSAHSWAVPPTRGPRRKEIGADVAQAFARLIALLDTVTADAAARELAAKAQASRISQRGEPHPSGTA